MGVVCLLQARGGLGVLAGAQLFEVVRLASSEKGVPDWNFMLLYHVATSAIEERFLKEGHDRDCLEKAAAFDLKREEVLQASPNSYQPVPDSSVVGRPYTVDYYIEFIAVRDTPAALNEYREAMRLTFGPVSAERMRNGILYNFYGF